MLTSLYSDHHRWLKAWLRRKLGNEFDAADLAHDTYVHLIDTQRFPPVNEAAESRRYLSRIANGLVVDLYRRRQIEAAYLDAMAHLPEALSPSEEDRALAVAALIEVDAILHALSPNRLLKNFSAQASPIPGIESIFMIRDFLAPKSVLSAFSVGFLAFPVPYPCCARSLAPNPRMRVKL